MRGQAACSLFCAPYKAHTSRNTATKKGEKDQIIFITSIWWDAVYTHTHTHRYGTHLRVKKKKKVLSVLLLHPLRRPSRRGREEKYKEWEKRRKSCLFLSFFLPSFRSFVSFRVCEIRRGLDSIFRSGFSRNERANGLGGWKVVVVLCGVSSPAPTATALHLILIKEVEEPGQRESTLKFAAV